VSLSASLGSAWRNRRARGKCHFVLHLGCAGWDKLRQLESGKFRAINELLVCWSGFRRINSIHTKWYAIYRRLRRSIGDWYGKTFNRIIGHGFNWQRSISDRKPLTDNQKPNNVTLSIGFWTLARLSMGVCYWSEYYRNGLNRLTR